MRAGVLSTGIFGISHGARPVVKEKDLDLVQSDEAKWSEEAFARQQIRNLTRQVFPSGREDVRHVVFGAVETDVNVNDVCLRVGNALSFERQEDVLVVLSHEVDGSQVESNLISPIRSCAARVDRNLWQLTVPGSCELYSSGRERGCLMQAIRSEFQYSVIGGSIASSTGSRSLAEFADGVVLVISALRTRRAAAKRLLGELSCVRVLGTVLQDREFPIPEGIYRRL